VGFRRRSRSIGEVKVLLKNQCAAAVCSRRACGRLFVAALLTFTFQLATPAYAADSIEGQVLGGGAPIAKSTVTLWSASADAPKQLAQTQTGDDGRFTLSAEGPPDSILYLGATGGIPAANKGGGDNSAIALISVVGSKPRAQVVINEITTVASVWTNAQFLDGAAIKGNALGLRIAASNVPNFVDLETDGWDPLSMIRSTDRRRLRWPTSRRWPTYWPAVLRG
jgi:hypothetical protein